MRCRARKAQQRRTSAPSDHLSSKLWKAPVAHAAGAFFYSEVSLLHLPGSQPYLAGSSRRVGQKMTFRLDLVSLLFYDCRRAASGTPHVVFGNRRYPTEREGFSMKRTLGVAVVMAVALVMFSPSAQAEFYVGASATSTTAQAKSENFDEDDIGWKIYGGYNFIKYFGLELDYRDMGSFAESGSPSSADLTAAALSARGILPLGKHFELSARLGYMAWDLKGDNTVSDDDFDLTYGLGAAFIIGSHVEIRLEYEILEFTASEGTNATDVDVDTISLGAAFRF